MMSAAAAGEVKAGRLLRHCRRAAQACLHLCTPARLLLHLAARDQTATCRPCATPQAAAAHRAPQSPGAVVRCGAEPARQAVPQVRPPGLLPARCALGRFCWLEVIGGLVGGHFGGAELAALSRKCVRPPCVLPAGRGQRVCMASLRLHGAASGACRCSAGSCCATGCPSLEATLARSAATAALLQLCLLYGAS